MTYEEAIDNYRLIVSSPLELALLIILGREMSISKKEFDDILNIARSHVQQGGVGVTWGSITGTISFQSDLQAVLNNVGSHKQDFGIPFISYSNNPSADNTILSNQVLDGSTVTTFLKQPDVPRVIYGLMSSHDADGKSVTIHGTNIAGNTISDTKTVTAEEFTTIKAFKTVTSIDLPISTSTLNLGFGVGLGLDSLPAMQTLLAQVNSGTPLLPNNFSSITVDNTDVSKCLFTPGVNGTDSYQIWYVAR